MQTTYVTQAQLGYLSLRRLREACATWTNRRLETHHVEALRALMPEAFEISWLPAKMGPNGMRLTSVEDCLGISMTYLPGPGRARKKPNALECKQRLVECKRRLLLAFANHPRVIDRLGASSEAQPIAAWPAGVDLTAAYELPRDPLPPRPGTAAAIAAAVALKANAASRAAGALISPIKANPSEPLQGDRSAALVETPEKRGSLAAAATPSKQDLGPDAEAVARAREYADDTLEVLAEVAQLSEGEVRARMGNPLGTKKNLDGGFQYEIGFLRRALSQRLRREFFDSPRRAEAVCAYDLMLNAISTLNLLHAVIDRVHECSMVSDRLANELAKMLSGGGIAIPPSSAMERLRHLAALVPEHVQVHPATRRLPELVRFERRTRGPALSLLGDKRRELRARDPEAWMAGSVEDIQRLDHLPRYAELKEAARLAEEEKAAGLQKRAAIVATAAAAAAVRSPGSESDLTEPS